ncbi:hypothetical protein [uncultured Mediterranean phage uvMED]|nr:hypothetical protein [uncultured Mediterranean phage uvMED]BAQ93327.1 hypothetical protein [uncultured Mediterranean phage uvMED]BAQ93348.1 hypothetical protein [uncultured Mediterranean phage uvMED]BAR24619.1 hypothetical protein [uncultured Mediterranean phage uvMED]
MLPKNGPYDPSMEWMVVEQSLEEELTLEQSIRGIEDCENIDVLSQLCVAMARQQWHQGKLLKQAVSRVAELESVMF